MRSQWRPSGGPVDAQPPSVIGPRQSFARANHSCQPSIDHCIDANASYLLNLPVLLEILESSSNPRLNLVEKSVKLVNLAKK